MPFVFRGWLCGLICEDHREPLQDAVIRLYRPLDDQILTDQASADPGRTLRFLDQKDVAAKKSRLLAEAPLNEKGQFDFNFEELQPDYQGGPIEVDVLIRRVPGQKEADKEAVQLSLTLLQPRWRQGDDDQLIAIWEYCLPTRLWCRIRAYFDAWVICGYVRDCQNDNLPLPNLVVTAFDADWLTDDTLGEALTDAQGFYRIDYSSADFKQTFLSPFINVETPLSYQTGPDVYFRIQTNGPGSTILLNETRSDGQEVGRRDRTACFCYNFCLESPVSLECELTGPSGCVSAQLQDQTGTLIPITGTAQGIGFSQYTLKLQHSGGTDLSAAIIYADSSGNPSPGATTGLHQVSNGVLGFIDVKKLVELTGNDLSTSASFTLDLEVLGIDQSIKTCQIKFQILVANVYIKTIGGGVAIDVLPPAELLRVNSTPGSNERIVGGNISVRGAAEIYGCTQERTRIVELFHRPDTGFVAPQPVNGPATDYDPAADGWTLESTVTYDDDTGWAISPSDTLYSAEQKWDENPIDGPTDYLSYQNGWFTRTKSVFIPFLGTYFTFQVPDIRERRWATSDSGQYSVLLKVTDTSGQAFYDIQRVWLDNKAIRGKIDALQYQGGAIVPPCQDLSLGAGQGIAQILDILGFATDPLADTSDTSYPSDNFGNYRLTMSKQGTPGEVEIIQSTAPVPSRAIWVDGPGDPPNGLLASLPLSHLDAGSSTAPTPAWAAHQLGRGESCTYIFRLRATDLTLVSEVSTHHLGGGYIFPVKIINDL